MKKIFNRSNMIKIITIFVCGLFIRLFFNNLKDIFVLCFLFFPLIDGLKDYFNSLFLTLTPFEDSSKYPAVKNKAADLPTTLLVKIDNYAANPENKSYYIPLEDNNSASADEGKDDDPEFRNKFYNKCRTEFREFCDKYGSKFSLTHVEFENLNKKLTDLYYRGLSNDEVLPKLPENIRPHYSRFLEEKRIAKERLP